MTFPELIQNLPRRFHHSKTVAVARMVGAGIGKRRHSQLPDAPQSLKLGGVNQPEQKRIGRLVKPKRNYVMNRISNDFFWHRR